MSSASMLDTRLAVLEASVNNDNTWLLIPLTLYAIVSFTLVFGCALWKTKHCRASIDFVKTRQSSYSVVATRAEVVDDVELGRD